MTDKIKEAYNAWYAKEIGVLGTPHYKAWFRPWVASRQSLEIELPAHEDPSYFDAIRATGVGYNAGIDECRKSIEAAGLKIK